MFLFFENFQEILRFLKILSKFSQKFMEKLRKFSKYGLVGSWAGGGGTPRS